MKAFVLEERIFYQPNSSCKPARGKNGISISRNYWPKNFDLILTAELFIQGTLHLLHYCLLHCHQMCRQNCFFIEKQPGTARQHWGCYSISKLPVKASLIWHCLLWDSTVLVWARRGREGEDMGEVGLVCPEKATPALQFQLLPKTGPGNILGAPAIGWYCCPELFPLFRWLPPSVSQIPTVSLMHNVFHFKPFICA